MSRPVLSADDVRAAHRRREHRLTVPAGAIVTPLARDEAAKWGIELVEGKQVTPEAPSSATHVPTCDPDDLERVVERVRARVPDADPAVVREIAERVLARLER